LNVSFTAQKEISKPRTRESSRNLERSNNGNQDWTGTSFLWYCSGLERRLNSPGTTDRQGGDLNGPHGNHAQSINSSAHV
jgi:hypothetical protein